MVQYDKIFDNSFNVQFILDHSSEPWRRQVQFCHHLSKRFCCRNGKSPCQKECPEATIKRQMLNYYLSSTCNSTSQNGQFKIEILSPNLKNKSTPHQIQTDDKEFIFSLVFVEHIKKNQQQTLQRANWKFTSDVFSTIYSYNSLLDTDKTLFVSPPQTSRISILSSMSRQNFLLKINVFDSQKGTDTEVSHITKKKI